VSGYWKKKKNNRGKEREKRAMAHYKGVRAGEEKGNYLKTEKSPERLEGNYGNCSHAEAKRSLQREKIDKRTRRISKPIPKSKDERGKKI